MQNNVVPITDEQAKAVQEFSKLGNKALDLPLGLAGYIAKILGTVPEDAIGLYVGDPLRFKRIENLLKHQEKVEALLSKRKVAKTEDVSPRLAAPILENAANESQKELQDIWARLMAAATDPARASGVRLSFIEAVKQMDPLDALVLQAYNVTTTHVPNGRNYLANFLKRTEDEIEVSFDHLKKIGVLADGAGRDTSINPFATAMGRELKRVLRD